MCKVSLWEILRETRLVYYYYQFISSLISHHIRFDETCNPFSDDNDLRVARLGKTQIISHLGIYLYFYYSQAFYTIKCHYDLYLEFIVFVLNLMLYDYIIIISILIFVKSKSNLDKIMNVISFNALKKTLKLRLI